MANTFTIEQKNGKFIARSKFFDVEVEGDTEEDSIVKLDRRIAYIRDNDPSGWKNGIQAQLKAIKAKGEEPIQVHKGKLF